MGMVCTSSKNKIQENHQYLKLVQQASITIAKHRSRVCHEMSVVVIGFLRQIIYQKKIKMDINLLILRSDIKQLCALYCGSTAGDLVIERGRILSLKNVTQSRLEYNSILIKKNATLTVPRWDPRKSNGGLLDILCNGNIILEEGASINLNGRGYHGGHHGRNGESFHKESISIKSTKNNYGGGGGAKMSLCGENGACTTYGAGGGYADSGSNGVYPCNEYEKDSDNHKDTTKNGDSGAIYGENKLKVLHLGSGGGGGYRFEAMDNSLRAEKGGSGGGALKLQVLGSIVMKKGAKICCNGTRGGANGVGGAGSGGSIRVVVNSSDNLKMDLGSTISAIGGINKSNSGNGGSGRIRLQFLDETDCKQQSSYNSYFNVTPKPHIG